MANSSTLPAAFHGMMNLPATRLLALLLGLAATFAILLSVFMWAQSPGYRVLYNDLSDEDVAQVAQALGSASIPYRMSANGSAVLVPGEQIHQARLQLAGSGLPKGGGVGFEILQKDQGFGTSRFLENARFQRALEGELARTISTLQSVQSARIHLAVPKQSVFLRKQQKPTASVLIRLSAGRKLERAQVESIVHLVSGSVPSMSPSDVKVVDQRGRLLNGRGEDDGIELTSSQFEYTQRVEKRYAQSIQEILGSILGDDSVRAQVVATLDFTVTERTSESYNPDLPAIRSEQMVEERTFGSGSGASGVPGALSNQPPAVATAGGAANLEKGELASQRSNRQEIRNYELDKTISHTKLASGNLRRLSIAVVLDDRKEIDEDGEITRTPLSAEELARFTTIIKETVGFNPQRGDSINVINASFTDPEAIEELPEPPIWEQPWVWSVGKNVLVGILALLVIIMVLRPTLRSLTEVSAALPPPQPVYAEGSVAPGGQTAQTGSGPARLSGPAGYDDQLNVAREMVNQDPKRVAQVVKTWVKSDGE